MMLEEEIPVDTLWALSFANFADLRILDVLINY